MKYSGIREEELKNKIAEDYFEKYDCTKIIGDIDFCVTLKEKNKLQQQLFETESLLWAEAKTGTEDIYNSITQLILTIGKARTFDKVLPPAFLAAFDYEKIAFIAYNDIHDIFYINDFNWNVTPSNHETKEFKLILDKVTKTIKNNYMLFHFGKDDKEISKFIKTNFIVGKSSTSKIKIDKNNFMVIYNKWLSTVKPTIAVEWDIAKKSGIIDGDFYLADILSTDNESLKDKLFVFLMYDHYVLDRHLEEDGMFSSKRTEFTDNQKAHTLFWNKYERPPKEEYWDYIVRRRDLLVPQDVRERKGSFFTPQIWVELSQEYLTEVLGEDWQDEYYIWDCAAGTGNLLHGLTNRYNIWASTLNKQDVEVMHDRIKNGANLLDTHVFQFDFLNDDFNKLPEPLQNIINDPEKKRKLVIYINPPYAEAGDSKQRTGTGKNKTSVAFNKVHDKYHSQLAGANRQLFAQFLIRIFNELENCKIGEFSTLKTLSGAHFGKFREFFKAKLIKGFIVPAYSFDNVNGQFPIGFKIWDTGITDKFDELAFDVFDEKNNDLGIKRVPSFEGLKYFSQWVNTFKLNSGLNIGWLQGVTRNDFQNQNGIIIKNAKNQISAPRGVDIYDNNLTECCVCFATRMCISANWLNDCDQFLLPKVDWKNDSEFQSDCLIFTNFHDKNTVQIKFGTNHWIPFTEQEINAREKFESNFMTSFIKGKLEQEFKSDFFDVESTRNTELEFSEEALEVFRAGKELWIYYHMQPNCNVNASLYDIREHFQGRNTKGKMNNKSDDETYMTLITGLRSKLKVLAKKIEPKVYEYEFLKK